MKIILIRHFMTEGNMVHRYIGKTEEPVCKQGFDAVKGKEYPTVEYVYVSPMKRCIQTAEYIYKDIQKVVIEELKECDFGAFENKNYIELKDNLDYQRWIDSNATLPFPGGEAIESFKSRCLEGFKKVIEHAKENHYETIAIIAHGGTFMSILDGLERQRKGYYGWKLDNGQAYITEYCECGNQGYLSGTRLMEEKV